MKKWIVGDDGEREWLCKHGVGHGENVHTCDGCCSITQSVLRKKDNIPDKKQVFPKRKRKVRKL